MKAIRIFHFIGITVLFFSCSQQPVIDQEAEANLLMDLSREWAQAAQGDDLEKLLNYWNSDAVLMSPDQPALRGHDQLMEMLKSTENIPGFEVNWEPQEAFVSKGGDLGYVLVHNYFKFPDSTGTVQTHYGKGVEIWRKQDDGNWKNVVDIYNEDPTMTGL